MFRLFFILFILSAYELSADKELDKWKKPIEKIQASESEKIALGKLLFFDPRLSRDDTISCATCHHPKRGWTDLVPVAKAVGFHKRVGPRNSPTILNAKYNSRQFWDGRAKTLEAQALGPIEADVEMNMPLDLLIPKLNAIAGYKKLFNEVFPKEKLTKTTLAQAIAAFEKTIIAPDAPFDNYINGDETALSQEAKEGFELFKGKAHCTDCHDGFNFTDGSFHNVGLLQGDLKGKELGRYNVKHRAAWYGVMKTPTLRDVTKSYPYFHDGSVETLKEASDLCSQGGRHSKGVKNKSDSMKNRNLSKSEMKKVVTFMKALTSPDLNITIPTQFPQ